MYIREEFGEWSLHLRAAVCVKDSTFFFSFPEKMNMVFCGIMCTIFVPLGFSGNVCFPRRDFDFLLSFLLFFLLNCF